MPVASPPPSSDPCRPRPRRRWRAGLSVLAPLLLACPGPPAPGPDLPASARATRVVVLALDGVSAASFAGSDGAVDADVFPRLAHLAGESTVFADLASPSDRPEEAATALASGRIPRRRPSGPAILCRLFPEDRTHWFGDGFVPCPDQSAVGAVPDDPVAAFREFVEAVSGEAGLYFHASALAARPFDHLPDGRRYRIPLHPEPGAVRGRWGNEAALIAQGAARHRDELRLLDRLVGELVDRLEATGTDRPTLLLVTGLRGISFRTDEPIDRLSRGNRGDLLRVPAWLRTDGTAVPSAIDEPSSIVDLPATLLAHLGRTEPSWEDGVARPASAAAERWAMGRHHAPEPIGDLPSAWPEPFEARPTIPGTTPPIGPPRDDVGLVPLDLGGPLVAARLEGGLEKPPLVAALAGDRIVAVAPAYGPPDGDLWISLYLPAPPTADLRLAILEDEPPRLRPLPEAPPSPPDGPAAPAQRLTGFLGAVTELDELLRVRGSAWDRELDRPVREVRLAVGPTHLATHRPAHPPAPGRFTVDLPRALVPGPVERLGVAATAVFADGSTARIPMLFVREPDGVTASDGRTWRVTPQPVGGAIERFEVSGSDVVVSGWAADLEQKLPVEQIVAFRTDVAGAARPSVRRPDVAALLDAPALRRTGFTFRIPAAPADVREILALSADGDATSLPLLAHLPETSATLPRSAAPRWEEDRLLLDDHRAARLEPGTTFGWIEVTTPTGEGLDVAGWAYDVDARVRVVAVYAFAGPRAVGRVEPSLVRTDVEAALGLADLPPVGFSLSLRRPGLSPADLRLVALGASGRLGELGRVVPP